jgi:hypothetical protein
MNKIVIDSTHRSWNAVIDGSDNTIWLCFEMKGSGVTIQGNVDNVLGNEEFSIGIRQLKLFPDDGSFIVSLGEREQGLHEKVCNRLIQLYRENKYRFEKSIKKDIKNYRQGQRREGKLQYCQSCAKKINRMNELGTNVDGTLNMDYCRQCFEHGEFNDNLTMIEMAERSMEWFGDFFADKSAAKKCLLERLKELKRWNDDRVGTRRVLSTKEGETNE